MFFRETKKYKFERLCREWEMVNYGLLKLQLGISSYWDDPYEARIVNCGYNALMVQADKDVGELLKLEEKLHKACKDLTN